MPPTPSKTAADLRGWQVRMLEAASSWSSGAFLVAAAPGAGKTRPAVLLARSLLDAGEADRVVVVCPTAPLTRQWAAAAATEGLQLQPGAGAVPSGRDFDGIAVTYARVARQARALERTCGARTLVVADEVHHLGDDLSWGEGFRRAFGSCARWLLLSGTPFRSDDAVIPGVRYDDEGYAVPAVSYAYGQATADGVCRRVRFVPFDGTLVWQSGDRVVEAGFDTDLTHRERGRRYRTALSTSLPDGLPRILGEAHERLEEVRSSGHRFAGGLVVASDSEHAREIRDLLGAVSGRTPELVLHTDSRAHDRLRAFAGSSDPWMVAVNMVSEGVDIPRLRVGVYATLARTAMMFRQIVGRFVRTGSGPPGDSLLFIPGDPVLTGHAERIDGEIERAARRLAEDEDLDRPEPADRQASDPSERPGFVPLLADVAPQLNLFGTPEPAPATASPPSSGPAVAAVSDPAPAAYERRRRLRLDRKGLVADLARARRSSHQEVNRWVNERVGIVSVDDATLDQLERSVELLFRALSTSSRRRSQARAAD